jgi:hypothetical protein
VCVPGFLLSWHSCFQWTAAACWLAVLLSGMLILLGMWSMSTRVERSLYSDDVSGDKNFCLTRVMRSL